MKKEKGKNLIRRLTAFARQFADAEEMPGIHPDALVIIRNGANFALTGRKPTGQHEEVARAVAKINAMPPEQGKRWIGWEAP